LTGAQIAGYQVEREIGRGAMAVVYLAKDPGLDRVVALKVFAPELAREQDFRRRLAHDSRIVAAIDHPHIVSIFDAGEADGLLYIAMRYVPGPDLGTLLNREGPLPVSAALRIAAQAASALDAAHEHGVVHGDVKPGSILVTGGNDREGPFFAYVTDFGLAKPAGGEFLGTLEYIAPERISGRPGDGRSDQYSLACVVHESLAGKPPFQREEGMALLWAHQHDPPPPLSVTRPGIAPGADAVMAKALAKSPEDRYASCQEFVAALRSAVRSATGSAPMPEWPTASAPTPVQPPSPSTGTAESTPPGPPFGDDDDEW
jgi:serine/threonine-protein kinase